MFDAPMDWLIIIVVALIIFGGTKKIPEMARNLGKATGEYKRGQMEIENELKNSMNSSAPKPEGQVDYMKIAQDLNIDTNNKTIAQIIKEINEKLNRTPETKTN